MLVGVEPVPTGLKAAPAAWQAAHKRLPLRELAVDGQCGTICRAYREHQMSTDDSMLRKISPRVKKATGCMLIRDTEGDGILDGAQYNTLDTTWYGANAWLSSLYLAAVHAAGAMAGEMGDAAFAAQCGAVADSGHKAMAERLFNGEYFMDKKPARRTRRAKDESLAKRLWVLTEALLSPSSNRAAA